MIIRNQQSGLRDETTNGRLILKQIENQFTTYHYTDDNQLATLRYWHTKETLSECQEVIHYDYNPRGQLSRATNSQAIVEYDYNPKGGKHPVNSSSSLLIFIIEYSEHLLVEGIARQGKQFIQLAVFPSGKIGQHVVQPSKRIDTVKTGGMQ